ncbi:MAG: DUF5077 domain-containing protein [Bacteroidota bacterium]|nr:DUF5077 domain-containing protein [Bacteroidota bacterium]
MLFGCSRAQTIKADNNSFHVTLFSNGYIYPDLEDGQTNTLSKQGLFNWKNSGKFTKTFFYPQQAGNIQVALKLKSPEGTSKIKIQLDNIGKSYNVSINKSDDFITVPVGNFSIMHARYHYLEISGISKTGTYFPDIESLIISGPAAKDLKYNLSE